MRRIAKKKDEKRRHALALGYNYKPKKIFTLGNKLIVWVKRSIGIYGVTFLAPLFLSIPIGSIVCAKFYGHKKMTFPLMVFYTLVYGLLMSFLIELI